MRVAERLRKLRFRRRRLRLQWGRNMRVAERLWNAGRERMGAGFNGAAT